MSRIIVNVKSFEADKCSMKNIINRILHFRGDISKMKNSELCQYKNRQLLPVESILEDDIVIDCKTSWTEIVKHIK